ncbi:polysaccharide deacetylase family protein, partial [Actinomycetota bacterium]
MIDSKREFWWDEVEKIFLIDFNNYKPLEVFIKNNRYYWDIKNKHDSKKAYYELIVLMRLLGLDERNSILEKLFNWSNNKKIARKSHKIISKIELQSLAKDNLFNIGSHTINHCSLAFMSYKEQLFEMSESKKILENIINKEVAGIAYPYGKMININKDTKRIAKEASYKFGVTAINSLVFNRSDLFFLPRYSLRSKDINDFLDKIETTISPKDLIDKMKISFLQNHL